MSEGIQITIPDFDDDDLKSTSTPFGRSAFAFGGNGFGASSTSLDSPSVTTPLSAFQSTDRSYFAHHARGDSSASIDSTHSANTRFPNKPSTPFSHSAQPSVATPSLGFTKKSSFASIRNAFKSGKGTSEAPPVPQIDHTPYPVLKNPFNRSTSSLNHIGPPGNRAMAGTPTSAAPPPYGRPPTPGSNESRFAHGAQSRAKSHAYSKSSGSVFHTSDGSDHGQSGPPPVPRMPAAFGVGEIPSVMDFEEDKVVMDPKTPADFALHAVFIRFATSAEEKIDIFIRQPLDSDPLLTKFMGSGVDVKFDEILHSLGIIAQKHAKKVIDSIMRWRRTQNEGVDSDLIGTHLGQSPSVRMQDISGILLERKSMASIHIMCRALVSILQMLTKDGLGDALGYSLEETTFEQLRKPDRKSMGQSANYRINQELYGSLLGYLTNIRFVTVTDRFLKELQPIAMGQVSKDLGTKYAGLPEGLQYVRIKVWPPEAFEEGAEFMVELSKSYANTHGFALKLAFTETIIGILHPIGKTAQAETNNPDWAAAIQTNIYPKARDMMSKPRYWSSAFPLVVTSLCVASQSFFIQYWQRLFNDALKILKDKDRQSRIIIMNGLVRIVWTYLYRCQESATTTVSKLEDCLRTFFPPNRNTVFPSDEHLEFLTYIVHFILSRHMEYGRELCLDLLQEPALSNLSKTGNVGSYLSPERTTIAINAVLLSLHNLEREVSIPTWPSSSDFSIIPSKEDYPTSSNYIPHTLLKPGMSDFVNRCASSLSVISVFCSNSVGHMSVFDDQWSPSRLATGYDESGNYIVRHHPDGITSAFPTHLTPHITLLQTVFNAWPRCLHPSLPLSDAIDMLLKGVVHVDPVLADAASHALRRFMDDDANAVRVVSSFNQFIFNPSRICQESSIRLQIEYSPLLALWHGVVDDWIRNIVRKGIENLPQSRQIMSTCLEVEAAALILLSHVKPNISSVGVQIVRILGTLNTHVSKLPNNDGLELLSIVHRLQGRNTETSYLSGYEELLDKSESSRLEQWKKFIGNEVYLRIADSTNDKDRKLWRYVFPAFLQGCLKNPTPSMSLFREGVVAAVVRYQVLISRLAGLKDRNPSNSVMKNPSERDGYKLLIDNKPLVDQWHIWVKILCSTAVLPDQSRPAYTQVGGRDHSRAPSDGSFERERYSSTRGLFRYLTPYLDSQYTIFRDAAVLCISSFPPNAYPHLLEDLSPLAGRQFYDDPRSKAVSTPAFEHNFSHLGERGRSNSAALISERNRRQEPLHAAVARIYFITAHLLEQQRSSNRQAALSNILKFVRNTQAFLSSPDNRDNPSLHRLRRYFCGTVERLFHGLANVKDLDRFIPQHMHLSLYRLCEEWCQLGPQSDSAKRRLAVMQRAVEYEGDPRENMQRFRHEMTALSQASVGALTSLCQKAFFTPEQGSGSPTERSPPEFMRPLSVSSILARLSAITTSPIPQNPEKGKATLRSLLLCCDANHELVHESLRRAVVVTENLGSSSHCFFEVIADIVTHEQHIFTFAQCVCLGLTNLRHPSGSIRSLAFAMLESIHHQHSGLLTMSNFDSAVTSLASSAYIHAHRQISDFLAGEHPFQAISILAQLGNWLSQLPGEAYDTNVILLLLQTLESWIANINLMTDDKTSLSREGLSCLYHLTALTLRYAQSHAEQILVLWTKLVDTPHESNGHAAIRFLLEQAHKVGNTLFVTCSSNVVASLCQTHIGRQVFDELCSVIVPMHMLPTLDHKLSFPEAQDMKLWEDLDALFSEQPRLTLGTAQFAWLFLADVALQQYWEMKEQLPILLHAIFTHLDHRMPFVRQQAQSMLFQILRSWIPGYAELPDRSTHRSRSSMKDSIASLEKEALEMYWAEEDSSDDAVPKMQQLCSRVISFLEPLAPYVVGQWGSLALMWGTACSIRATAFRSLQIFRALTPRIKKADFALLLGRLSNTIASPEENIQSFTSEIFLTINAVSTFNDLDKSLVPQVFWCACACLSTTVESEFIQTLRLLDCILSKIDLNDSSTIGHLLSQRPLDWQGTPYFQPSLLKGLRSSGASAATMQILQILAKIQDGQLIDPTDGRLRDLYTASLPWCLNAMDNQDTSLRGFAEAIALLAAKEKRTSIQKIMTSFAKGHFRTRDDFLRQSVASLREHYGSQYWAEIVTLLIGLVLNNERWLRVHAMHVLKVLFTHRESRNPVGLLGSELLMPLLRLLETDLAPQALDVLEEPMAMSAGGPTAKHVLRMSMHMGMMPKIADPESVPVVFGVPEASGWCIAQADRLRETCRANVMAVFDTCSVPTRPSRIEFEPEVEALAAIKTPLADDLGGLVRNLHELTTFFNPNPVRNDNQSIPARRLEARVAAILAKSTAPDSVNDTPQTPFLDVFRISGIDDSNDSDDYSDSDSDDDAFMFDSLTPLRPPQTNGIRHH